MSIVGNGQLAFDFGELEREDARGRLDQWTGAPLHFTVGYYAPAQLDAAFEHWCFLNSRFGSIGRSHMWHRFAPTFGDDVEFDGHCVALFSADLAPEREAEGPLGSLHLAVCEPCQWHTITADENSAVEAWHDHAVPEWWELPVVPAEIRMRNEKGLTALARQWVQVNYPQHMQVAGAPIITERAGLGTRHVPGYSPWGGYDLSSTVLEQLPREEPNDAMDRDALIGDVSCATNYLRPGARRLGR